MSTLQNVKIGSDAIAWEPNGKVDPWDHVESIMALNLLDFKEEALKRFRLYIFAERTMVLGIQNIKARK